MNKLHESIIQVVTVGGTDLSGNAKPQPTIIQGGPHWLKQQITEDMEASVNSALEQIAKGKSYDEWVKTTKLSPEVKSEVKAEFRCYSDALQSGTNISGTNLSTSQVKVAVKAALANKADEESRELNVVMFGLKEGKGDREAAAKVSTLFTTVGFL